ncbi:MAG: hypothetical protein AAGH74_14160 [Pseudomonadota bacterium]
MMISAKRHLFLTAFLAGLALVASPDIDRTKGFSLIPSAQAQLSMDDCRERFVDEPGNQDLVLDCKGGTYRWEDGQYNRASSSSNTYRSAGTSRFRAANPEFKKVPTDCKPLFGWITIFGCF